MIYVVVHSHYEEHWNVAVFSDRALAEKYKLEQDDAHIDIEEFELDDGPDWKALARMMARAMDAVAYYVAEHAPTQLADDFLKARSHAITAGLLEGQ